MKELSVAVLGGGRWARALTSLLSHIQATQRGHIRRVTQYNPPRSLRNEAPAPIKPTVRADSEDATMMGSLGNLADALAGKLRPSHTADSEDATMLGLPSKPARPSQTADSEDATMMGALDLFPAAQSVPIKPLRPLHTSDSEDSTMQFNAASLSRLTGPLSVSVKPPAILRKSSSDDATMMGMTSADLAAAIGQSVPGAPSSPALSPELREVASADLIFVALPASSVRSVLRQLAPSLRANQLLVHSVGSFFPAQPREGQPPLRISDVVLEETPITRIGALSGPALAEDLEEWSPAGLVCGSQSEAVVSATRQVLGCQTLRIYSCSDLAGVEVARAMTGVIALASGTCEALQFGIAARAMLVSRGAAEISRLGMAMGAKERTFLGLAGMGSLMVASQRTDSPDYQLGRLLATGTPLVQAEKQIARVCESTHMIRDGKALAESLSVRMPILSMLHRWIFEGVDLPRALKDLLEDPNYIE